MTELMSQEVADDVRLRIKAPVFGREYSQQTETQVVYFASQVTTTFIAINEFSDATLVQDLLTRFITDQYAIFWREPNDWSTTSVAYVVRSLSSIYDELDVPTLALQFARFLNGEKIQLGINPVEMQVALKDI
jgi:hypothetical protein